jgi:hypothetical protein
MKVGLFESNQIAVLNCINRSILNIGFTLLWNPNLHSCLMRSCGNGNAFVPEHNIIYPTMFMTSGIITIDI